MKLTKKNKIVTHNPWKMPINSVGVIRDWNGSSAFTGMVVKRFKFIDGTDCLVSIVEGDESYWTLTKFFDNPAYKIELLNPGDVLEIE